MYACVKGCEARNIHCGTMPRLSKCPRLKVRKNVERENRGNGEWRVCGGGGCGLQNGGVMAAIPPPPFPHIFRFTVFAHFQPWTVVHSWHYTAMYLSYLAPFPARMHTRQLRHSCTKPHSVKSTGNIFR